MQEFGRVLRQADLKGFAKQAAPLIKELGGDPKTLDTAEKVMGFAERLAGLIEKFGNTMVNLQKQEAANRAAQAPPVDPRPGYAENGATVSGEIWGGGYDDTPAPRSRPQPAPAPQEERAAPPQQLLAPVPLDPQKVYSMFLHMMADVDPDMTMDTALTYARDFKDQILPLIAEKLRELE